MFSLFQPKQLDVHSAYDMRAKGYDGEENFLVAFEKKISSLRQLTIFNFVKSTLSALDVGCGTGRHLPELEKYFTSVTGLDISENMLLEARRKATKSSTELICTDFQQLVSSKKYNFINCSLALIYFREPIDFFNKCRELLHEDGVLYIVDATEYILNKGTVPIFNLGEHKYQIQHKAHNKELLLDSVISSGFEVMSYREYSMDSPESIKHSDHLRHLNIPSLYVLIAQKKT